MKLAEPDAPITPKKPVQTNHHRGNVPRGGARLHRPPDNRKSLAPQRLEQRSPSPCLGARGRLRPLQFVLDPLLRRAHSHTGHPIVGPRYTHDRTLTLSTQRIGGLDREFCIRTQRPPPRAGVRAARIHWTGIPSTTRESGTCSSTGQCGSGSWRAGARRTAAPRFSTMAGHRGRS